MRYARPDAPPVDPPPLPPFLLTRNCSRARRVSIAYPNDTAGDELTQWLNVVFGNTSLKPGVAVVDVTLSPKLLADTSMFPGARFGVQDLRKMLGVSRAPLLMTALKPMGKSSAELARMAYLLARGGCDIIKDDHGLADQVWAPFEERVAMCSRAVALANAETGRNCLYAPSLNAPCTKVLQRAWYAKDQGCGAIMLLPGITGFDCMRELAADPNFGLPILLHPAMLGGWLSGSSGDAGGFTHDFLFGTLPRLLGADAVIFPNAGGRFKFTPDECQAVAEGCRRPMGRFRPALPCPAGGMKLHRCTEMRETFGDDTLFLIGGALLQAGPDLEANARAFADAAGRNGPYAPPPSPSAMLARKNGQAATPPPTMQHSSSVAPESHPLTPAGRALAAAMSPSKGLSAVALRCMAMGEEAESSVPSLPMPDVGGGTSAALESPLPTPTVGGRAAAAAALTPMAMGRDEENDWSRAAAMKSPLPMPDVGGGTSATRGSPLPAPSVGGGAAAVGELMQSAVRREAPSAPVPAKRRPLPIPDDWSIEEMLSSLSTFTIEGDKSKVLRFSPSSFRWSGVPVEAYKQDGSTFKGVSRVELIGKRGESAAQHTRYFECAPGGFSTLERHEHQHTVVVIRGQGEAQLGPEIVPLSFGDVVYTAPNHAHQVGEARCRACVSRVRANPLALSDVRRRPRRTAMLTSTACAHTRASLRTRAGEVPLRAQRVGALRLFVHRGCRQGPPQAAHRRRGGRAAQGGQRQGCQLRGGADGRRGRRGRHGRVGVRVEAQERAVNSA